jgi:phosphoserine phosphatase
MTKIILVRHGRTLWNREEIFRGTEDVPLDDYGRREAASVREVLRSTGIHAAYSSPLSRARETAEIILQPHGIQVRSHAGLADLHFGDWQGLSHQEVKARYPGLYTQWKRAPHSVVFPNGQSLDSVRDRALQVTREAVEKHKGQAVLLVAHRVVNKVLICALLGLDNSHFWQIAQDPAAVNVLEHSEGTWVCRLLNDTCHLRDSGGGSVVDF